MKKQILKALMVLAVIGSASTAMATQTISGAVTIGAGSNTFAPSSKVVISLTSISTSYCAGSAHLNGIKEYGTCGGTGITGSFTDVSKVYVKDYTTTSGSTVATPTAQSSATQLQGSGWQ
jgi:hypothetical protein